MKINDILQFFSSEKRSDDNALNPLDDDLYKNMWNTASSGKEVTKETAERVAAIHACVTAISETTAMLPGVLFREVGDKTKERATDHYLYPILHDQPNEYMDSMLFYDVMMRNLLYHGNMYAFKGYTKGNQLEELIPLYADYVEVKIEGTGIKAKKKYLFNDKVSGKQLALKQEDVFHIMINSDDGFTGRSPIRVAIDDVALAQGLAEFGTSSFENMARPDGIIKVDGVLEDDEARERLRKSWEHLHKGPRKAGKIAVFEQGSAYEPISMKHEEAQLVELLRFSKEQIATIFRCPPHIIQDLTRATFSNVEEQSINFVRYTCQPYFVRWEKAIKSQIIKQFAMDEGLYFKFMANSLLRGSFKERNEGYASAVQNGWMNRDEVRYLEDLNPIESEDGDVYLVQSNLTTVEKLTADPAPEPPTEPTLEPEPENEPETEPEEEEIPTEEGRQALFCDAIKRLATKEKKAVCNYLQKEDWKKRAEEFYSKHHQCMRGTLKPLLEAFYPEGHFNLERFCRDYPIYQMQTLLRRSTGAQFDIQDFVNENRMVGLFENYMGDNTWEQ